MRRLQIVIFWLFKSKNNVTFWELLNFCFKPRVNTLAKKFITKVEQEGSFFKMSFITLDLPLYWPKLAPIEGAYQVICETFDQKDWHYYQKKNTKIREGERLLDVGAAEGLFALSVADFCEKIILIEPNDYFVSSLQKTFRPIVSKVEIHNVAVGAINSEILFNNESLSGRITTDSNGSSRKKIMQLDTLLAEEAITYIKADIEGFELEMLKGAEMLIKRNLPKIAITTYHHENKEHEIIKLIKSFVPEYQFYTKGIIQGSGKSVMVHFWIPS